MTRQQPGNYVVKVLQDNGQSVSESTVLQCRTMLGWTWRGSAYCQLIREGNKSVGIWMKQKMVLKM